MLTKTSVLPSNRLPKTDLWIKKLFPSALIILGVFLLAIVLSPLFQPLLSALIFPNPVLINPSVSSSYPVPVVIGDFDGNSGDYTRASTWFVKTIPLPSPAVSKIAYFSLSIPEIGLSDVAVEINGSNLKKNAIHYPGTALPGDFGNTVIFGHSALPQFYRPKDPLTIFNPLLKVKLGQKIQITFDGIEYNYQVKKITQVEPDQIEVLSQNFGKHELTLITCVPLGTYWHRLVVRAELTK